MAKKMLIDATHDEEVRVAIVDGNRLEEFDSETSTKRQIKGNIYLAKVIRIEPSLQAAFVEFGGNRHGFLPFGEIHPDYFRIPVADRSLPEPSLKPSGSALSLTPEMESLAPETESPVATEEEANRQAASNTSEAVPAPASQGDEETEDAGADLVDEDDLPRRPRNYHYKIQEVIKRRQIMLIQVVKEERGNKGAALTTYLSLPGRYCVLMPNAGHRGGGISRKINDGTDRRRLREVLKELEIPEGMSLIVRTAGQERNRLEIRRDFDYLIRLWEDVRSATLQARAPELIYAEGDLIKRSIRDIYNRDIDQILVDGEEAYKAAKGFMKTLIPSHTKKVQPYRDVIPLFYRHNVEEQIDAIMYPTAKLPSGGSIVINSTEALVAIDVNSGRSTRERHIDDTALKTNLEAAEEIARQMRLRDLAGLIVIDFIDMSEQKHIQAVEKRLKEATRHDRARIQIGHISHFGLLEMSRQRLRPSLIEINSSPCSHCRGTGLVRSVESMSLLILRAIENAGIEGKSAQLVITVPSGVDLYLLNQKRASLTGMEARYQMNVIVARDDTLVSPDFRIECLVERDIPLTHQVIPLPVPAIIEEEETEQLQMADDEEKKFEENLPAPALSDDRNGRRRRRRRPSSRNLREDDRPDSQEGRPVAAGHMQEKPSMEDQITAEIMVSPSKTDASSISSPPLTESGPIHENEGSPAEKKRGYAHGHSGQDTQEGAKDTINGNAGDSDNIHDDPVREPARRRRRRKSSRHLSQGNGEGKNPAAEAAPVTFSASPVPVRRDVREIFPSANEAKNISRPKPAEVAVPITSLPVGAEMGEMKNSRGRWWKRLLES